jgi:predicted RNA binding protein YcfA (HicA-like mRNA interferase family)
MADICAELDDLEVENFERNHFIPLPQLEKCLTREKVMGLLKEHGIEFHRETQVADAVFRNGLRLFATLASIRSIKFITRFLEKNQVPYTDLDSKFPWSESSLLPILEDSKRCGSFLKRQWRFLAPVFRQDQYQRVLDERTILPFLSEKLLKDGGFSRVSKITVDGSHHQLPDTQGEVRITVIVESSTILTNFYLRWSGSERNLLGLEIRPHWRKTFMMNWRFYHRLDA